MDPAMGVVELSGELDLISSQNLASRIVEAARSSVIVDLARVTFMDCAALGQIVRANEELEKQGDCVIVRGATGLRRRLFEITQTDYLLND